MHAYTQTNAETHACMHMDTLTTEILAYARTHTCMHTHSTHTHMHTHTHSTHAHTHTRTHTHMHTHTHAHTHMHILPTWRYLNDIDGCSLIQQHYVQDKVFIGMDGAPEAFKLLDRLSGPGVSNKIYWVTKIIHTSLWCVGSSF